MPLTWSRLGGVATPDKPLDSLTILVVDDDEDCLDLAASVFAAAGADVHDALSTGEALDSFHDVHPDVVLTDVVMPDRSGIALLREIRRSPGGHVPVVALTAYPELCRSMQDGVEFDRVLTKPVHPEVLVDAVQDVIGGRRRTEE